MGAQEAFVIRQRGDTGAVSIGQQVAREDSAMTRMQPVALPGDVSFPYAFPRAGNYRIWVQVRRGDVVQTRCLRTPTYERRSWPLAKWALQGSNLRPLDYESTALTI